MAPAHHSTPTQPTAHTHLEAVPRAKDGLRGDDCRGAARGEAQCVALIDIRLDLADARVGDDDGQRAQLHRTVKRAVGVVQDEIHVTPRHLHEKGVVGHTHVEHDLKMRGVDAHGEGDGGGQRIDAVAHIGRRSGRRGVGAAAEDAVARGGVVVDGVALDHADAGRLAGGERVAVAVREVAAVGANGGAVAAHARPRRLLCAAARHGRRGGGVRPDGDVVLRGAHARRRAARRLLPRQRRLEPRHALQALRVRRQGRAQARGRQAPGGVGVGVARRARRHRRLPLKGALP